jgi:protein-disulfide isomerase
LAGCIFQCSKALWHSGYNARMNLSGYSSFRAELYKTMVFALPIAFLLGLGFGWLIWGRTGSPSVAQDSQVTIGQNVKRYDVPVGGNPTLGPDNAKVTIVEFSDYQCPYCIRWNAEVFDRLMTTYKGKIRFVYRDFPLYSIHPDAQSAAEAADCGGEQGAYWEFHKALFGGKYGLGDTAYGKYANDLGLNMDQFNKCVSERRYKSEVEADFNFVANLGISSTPTFFINGLAVIGAQPYEVFQQIIDKELAGEIPK